MADIRIKISKDKEKLVRELTPNPVPSGNRPENTFQSYAETLVFAASLGFKSKHRVAFSEYAKIDPIRQSVFENKGHHQVINLIAIAETEDPKILAFDEGAQQQRIQIFEEYANGGLEILEGVLRGASNYSEEILLFLNKEKEHATTIDEEFDLSLFTD